MVEPYLIQPDYSNAMVKGLSTNLAYIAESKKGGGLRISGGGGKKEPSKQEKDKEKGEAEEKERVKEEKERNVLYRARQDAEDKENLMNKEKEAGIQKTEAEAKAISEKQFLSHAPAVTQKNYADWIKFGEENDIKIPGLASPADIVGMKPEEFTSYMGGISKEKSTTGQSLERYTAEKKIAQQIEQENKRYERSLVSEENRVKLAKDFILRLAQKNKTGVADVLAMKFLSNDIDQKALDQVGNSIPEELKGAYDNAVKIVSGYYQPTENAKEPDVIGDQSRPPEGFVDTGKLDINGNRVYSNGVNAWLQPTR